MLIAPNMPSYEEACAAFSWDAARAELDGLPGGGLNICHEALDRHADGALADRVALRWLARDGGRQEFTYAQLRRLAARFATVLADLGVQRGERVFALTGRIVELYVAALGTLRHGAVFCPLFSAFGPEPVRQRLKRGGGRVLVTTRALYDRKVAGIVDALPELRHVLLADEDLPGRLDAAAEAAVTPTRPEDPALLHFTSGTTGAPKGAVHAHRAVIAHRATARLALDLHDGDVYWCTADPGWVTGTSYGLIAPLACGVTMIVDEGEFDADRWYETLEREHVTVWYTAPTAIRMLMRAGDEPRRGHELSALRLAASVGEPLAADAVRWGERVLGHAFHDTWWQTETGAIMIANFPSDPPRPGSMGRPFPGIRAAIARRSDDGDVVLTDDGSPEFLDEPGTEGELILQAPWPSMFSGYLGDEQRYRRCFAADWYLTGDLARRDADGWFWFVGRGDDVIKTAGHLVGPFEIESVLVEHPAVADAAAIGIPDPVAGAVVLAKVVLAPGYAQTPELRSELRGFTRTRLGPAIAPRRIDVVTEIPYTRSGKKLRQMLRIRRLEERCIELYSAAKIRGFLHVYIGEEAVAVGAMQALTPQDKIVTTYRDRGHALARGIPARAILAEMLGRVEGCSRGRGGSMHLFDAGTNFYGGNAIVASGLPLAVGLALAERMRGTDAVTVCFFGEGAIAEGEFHEALNLAALWRLPVLFLCENNLYAMGTALERSESQTDLALKAASYEIPAWTVDGMDVEAVAHAVREQVAMVRGGGPCFLEARTYRFRAHSMYDPDLYRAKEEIARWRERDPIDTYALALRERGALDDAAMDTLERDVAAEIDDATAFAEAGTLEPVEDRGVLRSTDMAGATLTVTSLGEHGADLVQGVIFPPQVALVGFGRIAERPVASGGMVGARRTVIATLAGDHRVSDGHVGSLFLAAVDHHLQEPDHL